MRATILLPFILLNLGCSDPRPDGPDLDRRSGPAHDLPIPVGPAFAFDVEGRPVAFDAQTGAIGAQGPMLGGVDRDLAFDPWTGEVAVFTSPEGDGGTLHRLGGDLQPSPGGPVTVDGRAEIWFGPEGLWLFEESYGTRWRRLRRDGDWEPGYPLPLPTSLWAGPGLAFGALVHTEDGVAWLSQETTSAQVPSVALSLAAPPPSEGVVRAAPLRDDLVLAWTTEDGVRICLLDPWGAPALDVTLPVTGLVRQASVSSLEGHDWLGLLLDEPPRLVAVDLERSERLAILDLNGSVDADHRVNRRLLSSPDGWLVATSHGVASLRLDGASLQLTDDPWFDGLDLRGPLAAPRAAEGTSTFQATTGSAL